MKNLKKELLTKEERQALLLEKYEVRIALGNAKLGKHIPNVNMPVSVCDSKNPCKKGCYASKDTYLYKSTQNAYNLNLEAFLMDSKKFFDNIIEFLNNQDVIYKYFRWHSSGDIVNMEYLKGIIRVAKECPQTKFLCFTKKFTLVNIYLDLGLEIPSNLTIVFSGWDKNFKFANPHNLPTTYVFFNDEKIDKKIDGYAYHCTGDCNKCKQCWNLKKGETLVFNKH